MEENKKGIHLKTPQIIALGFFIMITLGGLLLTLPISSATGEATPWVDALFTSTTSSCVTGLVTVVTADHWSYFGQVVILFLIQFGGLGVVTFTTFLLIFAGRRISIKQRLLIQDAYGLDSMTGVVRMVIRMTKGTLVVEGIGALLYMTVFVPEHGAVGIWYAIFTSVSAFCNAGIDLIGEFSMVPYLNNPIINMTTMLLIMIGGIGFLVWWDVIAMVKKIAKEHIGLRQGIRELALHSKVVILFTAILIFGGGLLVFLFEYDNPGTLGPMSLGNKIWASLFQSVTWRTAGFFTINQGALHNSTLLIGVIWMFIGGSPGGTAGGVKTMTIALLILAAVSMLKGREDVEIGNRRIPYADVIKGISVIMMQMAIWMVSTLFMCVIHPQFSFMEIWYEVTSALGTVGLTMGITPLLSTLGKYIIILTMYFGRLGPITLGMALQMPSRKKQFRRRLPEGKISI